MEVFTLKSDEEYIEMNQLLKLMQFAQSGGHAKIIIVAGLVFVTGEQEFSKRRKMLEGAMLAMEGQKIQVKA